MDIPDPCLAANTSRRRFLVAAAIGSAGMAAPVFAQQLADLHLPGGNGQRRITGDFPARAA